MQNVRYTEFGQISFEDNGSLMTIPDTQEMKDAYGVTAWVNSGNTIMTSAEYATSIITLQNINRVQFKAMLALLGKSIADVEAAIDLVITDPTQNTIAKVKVSDSDYYARDNELFTILAPSLNLTDAEIDTAWEQAVLI